MKVLLGAALAMAPWLWMRYGRRTPGRRDGVADGLLLLASMLCSLGALVFAGVAGNRAYQERRFLQHSQQTAVVVSSCAVTTQRTGGRDAIQSHELRCDVERADDRRQHVTVTAGFPSTRRAYDRWIEAHPQGSVIMLRAPNRPGTSGPLAGLDQYVPTTTSAAHAADRTLLLGAISGTLLLLSRIVAARARAG